MITSLYILTAALAAAWLTVMVVVIEDAFAPESAPEAVPYVRRYTLDRYRAEQAARLIPPAPNLLAPEYGRGSLRPTHVFDFQAWAEAVRLGITPI